MRGNEQTGAIDEDEGREAFPIPMRGNESSSMALSAAARRSFPIPMRGNEDTDDDLRLGDRLVSDPHEG